MFVMKEHVEKAWTPDIGGEFEDLQLEIAMTTPKEYDERYARCLNKEFMFDPVRSAADAIPFALSRVVGWRNTETPFSEENKQKFLSLLMNKDTGHLKDDGSPIILKNFIINFAGDSKNFLAV